MNKGYMPYSFSFDEEKLASELFSLKEAKVRSIVNYNIRNNSINTILMLVARYLLHSKKISAKEVRTLLRKYAVIIAYSYLKTVNNISLKDFDSPQLNKIIEDITVESLNEEIEANTIFTYLYNDINYIKYINELNKKLERKADKKVSAAIYKVLRGEFNYFSKNTNINLFIEYSDMKRFDMIVSEALLEPDFYSFSFEVDFLTFKKNFVVDNPTNSQIRMAMIFVGYVVYDIFNNNNFNFQENINFITNKMFVLTTLDKTASINNMNLSFIKKDGNNIYIDWMELKEFNFIYNKIQGSFSYQSIKYSMTGII